MTCATLLLNFHPDPAGSRAISALAAAAGRIRGVAVRELASLYPSGEVDAAAEAAQLLAADRVAMLFPVHWYAPPSTFSAWAATVLTRMFFAADKAEGERMQGKPLLVAATVGTAAEDYGPTGRSLYPLEVLLRPLEAMAHRCGLTWSTPFLLYRAGRLSPDELARACDAFAGRLRAGGAGCDGFPEDRHMARQAPGLTPISRRKARLKAASLS